MKSKQVKMERISRFSIPDLPIEDGENTSFKLKIVTMDGRQEERPCTQDAYKDFYKFRPDMQTQVTFMLKYNADGQVCDYSEVINAAPAGMFKQEMQDGRIIDSSERLIFDRKLGTKAYEPVFIPVMVGTATVEAIMDALRDGPEVEVSQLLLGKYEVHEITQRAGMESVVVDLNR